MLNQRKNKKKAGKGCLFLIIGSVLGVVALLLFLPLAGELTKSVVNDKMEGQVGYAMLYAAEPCIMVASLLLFGILVIHYFDFDSIGKSPQKNKPQQEVKTHKFLGTKLATWVATGVLLLGVVICAFVYATTYRIVTTEGVSNQICYFFTTDEYSWKQVSSYKVDCDEEKGLSLTFTMRDGKQIEILQSAQSAPRSFHEKYDCKEEFARDLIKMLEEEYQITPNIYHIERAENFYRDNEDLLPFVKEIIGYEELDPEEGELAETDAATDVATDAATDAATEGVTEPTVEVATEDVTERPEEST